MIKGMTGFGSAQFNFGQIKAVVEIKSLNHRYFDISYYLPTGFGSVEDRINQIVQKHIKRGRVTVSLKIVQKPSQKVTVNEDIIKQYLKHTQSLKKKYKLDNDLRLSDLIKMPGVLDVREEYVEVSKLWPKIKTSIEKSVLGLSSMRKREGTSLNKDISGILKKMSIQIKTIQAREKKVLAQGKKALANEEFVSFQKSNAISEELTRLKHYISEQKLLMKATIPVGKKIDFVAQEMQRETNTIGSKLQDKVVSNAVIALKSKIEKIREQAQNIE